MSADQMTFAQFEMLGRLQDDNVLVKLNRLINWQAFRPHLTGLYQREKSNSGGQIPLDPLMMFKAGTTYLIQNLRLPCGFGLISFSFAVYPLGHKWIY